MFWILFLLVVCYLLGSFPSGNFIAKRTKNLDLREYGSGSTGTTNAYRVLGAKGALAVLALDTLKGFLAVCLAYLVFIPDFMAPMVRLAFGFAAIAGHNWSIFLKFQGGKGVATSFGVLLALAPLPTLMAFLLWVGVCLFTRMASAASLTAAFSLPILMYVYGAGWVNLGFSLVISAVAVYQHRENIARLLSGQEKTIDIKFFK